MATSIADLLSYTALMKPVELVRAGIPKRLPAKFWESSEQSRVTGDVGRHTLYDGNRKTARTAPYGAPPRQVPKMNVYSQDFKLLHSIETMPYDQHMLKALVEWDSYEKQQKFFMTNLAYYSKNYATRQENLRIGVVNAMVAQGVAYFREDNLLPGASGADFMLDFGVPAENRNDCGGIFNQSWADPACNIAKQIANLQTRSLQTTGRALTHAVYGRNVAAYVAANPLAQAFLIRSPAYNAAYLNQPTILPNGLFGIDNWINAQDVFFEDQDGVVREQFLPDQISFFPDVSDDWYEFYEGSYMVPSEFGIFTDAMAALRSLKEAFGMFRYAYLNTALPQIHEVQGDTFLPRPKVPKCLFLADVTP